MSSTGRYPKGMYRIGLLFTTIIGLREENKNEN